MARVVLGSLADGSGPASILVINLLGCLVFGFAGPVFARSPRLAGWWPAVGAGFAGALSTWSTLAGEIVDFARGKSWWAVGYPLATVAAGATAAGLFL